MRRLFKKQTWFTKSNYIIAPLEIGDIVMIDGFMMRIMEDPIDGYIACEFNDPSLIQDRLLFHEDDVQEYVNIVVEEFSSLPPCKNLQVNDLVTRDVHNFNSKKYRVKSIDSDGMITVEEEIPFLAEAVKFHESQLTLIKP